MHLSVGSTNSGCLKHPSADTWGNPHLKQICNQFFSGVGRFHNSYWLQKVRQEKCWYVQNRRFSLCGHPELLHRLVLDFFFGWEIHLFLPSGVDCGQWVLITWNLFIQFRDKISKFHWEWEILHASILWITPHMATVTMARTAEARCPLMNAWWCNC